jgi:hypothetical protein
MRHGIETSSASLLARCSRVDAQAANAPRVAKITLDRDWEIYAVNMLQIPADMTKKLKTLALEATDTAFEPVIYAISTEEEVI